MEGKKKQLKSNRCNEKEHGVKINELRGVRTLGMTCTVSSCMTVFDRFELYDA